MILAPWLALCSAAQGSAGTQTSPFEPGERWSHSPDPSQPWIPRDVAFTGDGAYLWSAPSHGSPRLQLFSSAALGSQTPIFEDANLGGPSGPLQVACGVDASQLFSLAQFPASGGGQRWTRASRYDARSAARGAAFAPLWTRSLSLPANGPGLMACTPDGSRLALAAFDATRGALQLALLDGVTGDLCFELSLPGAGLERLQLADDAGRILVGAASVAYVLDASGQELFRRQSPQPCAVPMFSGDGSSLALGGKGVLELFVDDGTGYLRSDVWNYAASELCALLALSGDASTLASGWWDFSNGNDVRLEVLEVQTGALQLSLSQTGSSSGLQNFPAGLSLSQDGQRVAFGLWGTGDARPELYLFDLGQSAALLALDLEGSVQALDLNAEGTRLGVALKATHANLSSAMGRTALFQTGEGDLQLEAAARLGGQLRLRCLPPQASSVLFILGRPLAPMLPLKQGLLGIDWSRPRFSLLGQLLGDGSYGASTALPPSTALVGTSFAAQGLAFGAPGLRLSQRIVRFELL